MDQFTNDKENTPIRRLNTRGKVVVILALVFFAAGMITLIHGLFHAKQTTDRFVYELGEGIDDDPSAYLETGPVAALIAGCDLSEVDVSSPGRYPAVITYLGKTFEFEIEIRDTVSPKIVLKNEPFFILQGTELDPSFFVKNVKDADPGTILYFDERYTDADALVCKDRMTYTAMIVAEDPSGNTSTADVMFLVDDAPVFEGVRDFYVAAGMEDEILDFITATDYLDGNLTGDISLIYDDEEIPETGLATARISVTDSCGFTTTAPLNIYFDTPDAIQQLIGSGAINRNNSNIIGAINIYDTGLFTGQTISQTLEDVIPCIVHIRIEKDDGSITLGSGFIAEITDEDVYIITNKHVVGKYTNADIYFFSGQAAHGYVEGTDEDYDIAVIKIPMENMPYDLDGLLSTVHIDMTYWESLDDQDIELAIERMTVDGSIEHYTFGTLVKTLQDFTFFEPYVETEMVLALRPGDSGSAVFDKEGRLICMAFAYSISPERDWGVPLNEIVDAYTEITGRELYVY